MVIAGGHGKVAMRLARLLAGRGDTPVGLVRDPAQFADLRAAGAEPVFCDLESAPVEQVTLVVQGADALVFAAGAGQGSGAARKDTMDRGGAVLLADAAERAGVRRYLLISSMGVDDPARPGLDPGFAASLRAKAAAEDDVRRRDLDWTVLRPGRLTDEPGTGRVRLAPPPVPRGPVPRDDVAAVLAALLDGPGGHRATLELVTGDTPIREAVARVG